MRWFRCSFVIFFMLYFRIFRRLLGLAQFTLRLISKRAKTFGLAAWVSAIFLSGPASAATLLNFPFNEGSGLTTADSVAGTSGLFGDGVDPVTGPAWTNNAPSGATN